jgi:calcium permeable stress-gated cation channel
MILFPIEDISIDEISGLENYLFEYYLYIILRIFILLVLLILPILIPLNAVDSKNEQGGVRGLDRLSFANVGLSYTNCY